MRPLFALALGLACLAAPLGAAGADRPAAAPSATAANAPVRIRSDTLRVLQKKNSALFEGHVEAVQGDLTIRCQRLDVRYMRSGEERSESRGEIRTMVFSGDVRIEQAARRGHCERAEYDRPAGRIVCTGDPWVVEGDNRIRGTRIVYLLRQDEVQVSHPKAVLQLPEERKKKRR